MRSIGWVAGLAIMLMAANVAPAQESPTSRPNAAAGQPPQRMAAILERAQNAMEGLDLSSDQKTKVEAILKTARDQFKAMRPDLNAMDPAARMQKLGEFVKGVREQLSQVLTPEQRTEMNKKFEQESRDFHNGPPTSEPVGAQGRGGPFAYFDRLRDNLAKLDLSDDQKANLEQVADDLKAKAQELRQQAQNGAGDVRDKMRDLFQESRQKILQVLTPDQQQKLRELMGRPDSPPTSGPTGGEGRVGGFRERFEQQRGVSTATTSSSMEENSMAGDKMMSDDKSMAPAGATGHRASNSAPRPAAADKATGAAVGDPAPLLSLKRLEGPPLALSSLKGRVVVLEFGSWTSPAFRERAQAMEKLKTELGMRAQFFVVYTREAHAKGEWEVARNKEAGINVSQPTTLEARTDLAKKARQELKITTPILIDSMENEAAKAFGADANTAVVINREGVIVAKQNWFDASGLRHEIDDALKPQPATHPTLLGATVAAQ